MYGLKDFERDLPPDQQRIEGAIYQKHKEKHPRAALVGNFLADVQTDDGKT